jgi:hypothetical protein
MGLMEFKKETGITAIAAHCYHIRDNYKKLMKWKTHCWCLNIASLSITVADRKFTGFKDRKFSLTHFPYGFDKATRFLTSVFS